MTDDQKKPREKHFSEDCTFDADFENWLRSQGIDPIGLCGKSRLSVEGENGTFINVPEVLNYCDKLRAWFTSLGLNGPDVAIICQAFLVKWTLC